MYMVQFEEPKPVPETLGLDIPSNEEVRRKILERGRLGAYLITEWDVPTEGVYLSARISHPVRRAILTRPDCLWEEQTAAQKDYRRGDGWSAQSGG